LEGKSFEDVVTLGPSAWATLVSYYDICETTKNVVITNISS
jgi:hypothetical protein